MYMRKQLSASTENAALVRHSTNASVISMQAQAGQLPQLWEQAAVVEREGQADPAAQSQEAEAEVQVEAEEAQEILDAESILDLSAGLRACC